jgi:hypothetical protein
MTPPRFVRLLVSPERNKKRNKKTHASSNMAQEKGAPGREHGHKTRASRAYTVRVLGHV